MLTTPAFRPSPDIIAFTEFKPVDIVEITSLIVSLRNTQCINDPLWTQLLKECSAELMPFIFSSVTCHYALVMCCGRSSQRTPLLNKIGLDNTVVKNYRPISNLMVLSKLLE